MRAPPSTRRRSLSRSSECNRIPTRTPRGCVPCLSLSRISNLVCSLLTESLAPSNQIPRRLDGILAEVAELRAENMRLASDLQQRSADGDAGDGPVDLVGVASRSRSDGLDELAEVPRGSSLSPPTSKSPTDATRAGGEANVEAGGIEIAADVRESSFAILAGGAEESVVTDAKAKLSPRLGASAGEGGGEAAAQRKLVLDLDWE